MKNIPLKQYIIKGVIVIFAALLLSSSLIFAENFYKWTDENGVTHFSDSTASIPRKYLNQLKKGTLKKSNKTPALPESADSTKGNISKNKKEIKKLKSYRVPFIPFEGRYRRIIIPVRFNNAVTAPMALDTGAPGMIISFALADKLGLFDKKEGKLLIRAGGIGGSAPAVRTIIDTVQVKGAKDTFIPTTITDSLSNAFDGLIGMDFMARYSISIDNVKNVLIFNEVDSGSDLPGGHDENWWRRNFKEFRSFRDRWKAYRNFLQKQINKNNYNLDFTTTDIKKLKILADTQHEESEKLLRKLEQYASRHSVPIRWRNY